ncbi:MAG TPA: hypothetical protein VNA25_09705 [Phycisphaerae bacterium]|nr:hypothetical protein [Phycisphaerae bacterium]
MTDLVTTLPAPPEDGRVQHVGRFAMRMALADPSPEAAERWSRRAEVVAQWPIVEWQAAQGADHA